MFQVSLAILIACPWRVCFHRSWTSLAGVLKNVVRVKRFIRLYIVITETIKKRKIMIINSWLRWSVSLLKFIQTLDHTDTSPYKWVSASLVNDFGNFWTVSLEAYFWSSWTLTKCSLSWKTVKYRILSEVCMINSNVSPQMWCIKSIKGWFTHSQICWQGFVK